MDRSTKRSGVAATEFAVYLPILMLLLLAMLETCSMIFLKQSLAVAAYEGAYTALSPGATAADVQSMCQTILSARRIQNATISTVPSNLATVAEGAYFEVRMTASTISNGILPLKFFRIRTLIGAAKFMRAY